MRIALLSCFYPYRGGIAQFNSYLVKELSKHHTVKAFNFKRQYPAFLFPGKTQYVEEKNDAVSVESESLLDTANFLSYSKSAKKIAEWNPDILITRYWMGYFAPSLGFVHRRVAKILRKKAEKEGKPFTFKNISITDNAISHEKHLVEKPLAKYYFKSVDGVIAMSSTVIEDINSLSPKLKSTLLKHPLYMNYGEKIDKCKARKILLPSLSESELKERKVLLFFGLIRDYKGLDILLNTMPLLSSEYTLIIAGEPYGGFEKYQTIIDSKPFEQIKKNIVTQCSFIPDSQVKILFSAADLCILPYRSATQSGICSIAWNFELPQIATPVGGLPEYIGSTNTGLITSEISSESLAKSIQEFFANQSEEKMVANIKKLKRELSWEVFSNNMITFINNI